MAFEHAHPVLLMQAEQISQHLCSTGCNPAGDWAMLVRPCHNARHTRLTMLALCRSALFIHVSTYVEPQLGSPGKQKSQMECVTDKCSGNQDVLALSGGLALAPPFISSVAFTSGTSWSSSRNTLNPLSKTTCRLTA